MKNNQKVVLCCPRCRNNMRLLGVKTGCENWLCESCRTFQQRLQLPDVSHLSGNLQAKFQRLMESRSVSFVLKRMLVESLNRDSFDSFNDLMTVAKFMREVNAPLVDGVTWY